jgi:glycosyltransferase involved in cell wall biosynthesis
VPAVVADATGSKSLVESGVNGLLVPPKKTNQFAEAVVDLAHKPELRKRMSEAARQKALAYSWDTVMAKLVKNYEEALGQPRPELKF